MTIKIQLEGWRPLRCRMLSYVKGSHAHLILELCCGENSEIKRASKRIGSFYIGIHSRMEFDDVQQETLNLLRRFANSVKKIGSSNKGGKSVHLHISLPCKGGSPLLNFCTSQAREKHVAEFKELLGSVNQYIDSCREYDPEATITFELPHNNQYWKLFEIREFRDRFGLDFSGIVSCCQIGLRAVRTGRMIGKRYRVVSNCQKVTDVLHAKFARCRCTEEHAAFSEVDWHQTESYTRRLATVLIRTVIAFRITGVTLS